jgi:hypothetical protein
VASHDGQAFVALLNFEGKVSGSWFGGHQAFSFRNMIEWLDQKRQGMGSREFLIYRLLRSGFFCRENARRC